MGEPARLRLKVRHYEVDLYGHVNHANYVHYLEAARVEALEAVGLSLPEVRRQGYLIVAVELAVTPTASAADPSGPAGATSRTVRLRHRLESSAPEPRRRAR